MSERHDHCQPKYLPIEVFRQDPQPFWQLTHGMHGLRPKRIFRSSGTTATQRSASWFSEMGLGRYRRTSVHGFFTVLSQVSQSEGRGLHGLSLIPPPTGSWAESSLAQMVAWIASEVPVTYVDAENLPAAVDAHKQRHPGQPLWLFGTALHHLQVAENKTITSLPTGSVVFETGGLKASGRTLSRSELYQIICHHYAVTPRAIVSEYGMCELASQAYDWSHDDRPVDTRYFRFPQSVQLAIVDGPGSVADHGTGMLLVDDPQRVDFPWPLRTEDVVDLQPDGRFKILGRAPKSPLKGCSMLAAKPQSTAPSSHCLPTPVPYTRILELAQAWRTWLLAASTKAALSEEFGSEAAALSALEDLQASTPSDLASWKHALRFAPKRQRWLVIPPKNHSLAICQTVLLGCLHQLSLTVRIPAKFAHPSSFLRSFIDFARPWSAGGIATLAADHRVTEGYQGHDAIIAYGDSTTMDELASLAKIPVQSFGSHATASFMHGERCSTEAPLLVKDALALGQRGCLSTRLAVVYLPPQSATSVAEVAQALRSAAAKFWGQPLTASERLNLEPEAWRLQQLGFFLPEFNRNDSLLVACRELTRNELGALDPSAMAASRPFALPVLLLRDHSYHAAAQTVVTWLRPAFASISLPADAIDAEKGPTSLGLTALGSANRPLWDGTHAGQALFQL